MTEKIPINLTIAERRFSLQAERQEEEALRKAAKLLDNRIKQFREEYKSVSLNMEQIIIGASLSVVSELLDELNIGGRYNIERGLDEIKMMLEDSIKNI